MSDGFNRVQLLGNLGADPELRFTQGGQAVLNIRMATTESYLDRDKQRQERTEWHTVTVWGKRAEALGQILRKGSSIFVEGSLRTTQYEAQDGTKRYKTEVVARDLLLTGGRRSEGEVAARERAGAGGQTAGGYNEPGSPGDDIPF